MRQETEEGGGKLRKREGRTEREESERRSPKRESLREILMQKIDRNKKDVGKV